MNTEIIIPSDLRARVKVLIVEDNLLNQKLDSFIFSNWGLQHEICSNGQLAVNRLLAGNTYDVILMDIQMPVLNGFEATKVIREELKLEVPIIGITAHASEIEREKCIRIGMNHYITKPVNEEELFSLLMGCLAGSESLKTA
ncbi:MAG TPA: response regulator [Chitinophagaceae bacterium]|nr:response regulator [Chitinophagaceae bacterium]